MARTAMHQQPALAAEAYHQRGAFMPCFDAAFVPPHLVSQSVQQRPNKALVPSCASLWSYQVSFHFESQLLRLSPAPGLLAQLDR